MMMKETFRDDSGSLWERTKFRFMGRWVWQSVAGGSWAIRSEEGRPVVLTDEQADDETYRVDLSGRRVVTR